MPNQPPSQPSSPETSASPGQPWDFSALSGLTVHDLPTDDPVPPLVRPNAALLAEALDGLDDGPDPVEEGVTVAPDPAVIERTDPAPVPAVPVVTDAVPAPAKRSRVRKPRRSAAERAAAQAQETAVASSPIETLPVAPTGSTPRRSPRPSTVKVPPSHPSSGLGASRPASAPRAPVVAPSEAAPLVERSTNPTPSRADDALSSFLVRPSRDAAPLPPVPTAPIVMAPAPVEAVESPASTVPALVLPREPRVTEARAQRGHASMATWTDGAWSSATPEEKRHARRVFRILVGVVALVLAAVWWAASPSGSRPTPAPAAVHVQPAVPAATSTPHPAGHPVVPAAARAAPAPTSTTPAHDGTVAEIKTPTAGSPDPARIAAAPLGAVPVQAPPSSPLPFETAAPTSTSLATVQAGQPGRTTVVNVNRLQPPVAPSEIRRKPRPSPAPTALPAKPFHLDAPIRNAPSIA